MYGETGGIWYRKIGKWVEVSGIISVSQDVLGDTTEKNVCILPDGYRTNSAFYTVCQGSTRNIWLLTVRPAGNLQFSRYRVGDGAYQTIAANTWLPFHVTYSVL